MDQLNGFIDTIVFASEETGFTVARLKTPKLADPINIVGVMPGVNPGETIHCKGVWKHHSKHGRQFEVQSYELTAPVDVIGIQKYLESGMVKGVGPVYAKRIVDTFGVKTLEIIDKSPERLTEVPGIGVRRVEKIQQFWEEQRAVRSVMIFFTVPQSAPLLCSKDF